MKDYTDPTLQALARRVLDISYRHKLSHIGSCLTALPILYEIYSIKKPEDRVVLSAGHSGLAMYVVLEHFKLLPDAEATLVRDGIHPVRNEAEHIDCSTGSLGQGITVAVGMALAQPERCVYVVSTDGEMAEGAWWESLYFTDSRLTNLHVHVNANGYTALGRAPLGLLCYFRGVTIHQNTDIDYLPYHLPWFQGLEPHYHVMTEAEYHELDDYYAAL